MDLRVIDMKTGRVVAATSVGGEGYRAYRERRWRQSGSSRLVEHVC